MTTKRWVLVLVALIVIALLAKVFFFPPRVSDVGGTQDLARDTGGRYDCPDHGPVQVGDTTYTQLSVPGPITGIPEFHDCQRVITVDGGGVNYGPRIGLFASQGLGQFQVTPLQYQSPGSGAMGTSTLVPGPQGVTQAVVTTQQGAGPPAFVEVVAWGDYKPLGINYGISCLYIVPDPTRPTGLAGKMVHVALESQCANGANQVEGTVTKMLWVYPMQLTGYRPEDIPPVARWDWDVRNRKQAIGVRCGDTWCNIGLEHLQVPPAHAPMPPTNPKQDRVFGVKGWYDEQNMAVPGGGGLVPAPQVGTIFPDPGLVDVTDSNAFSGRWIPVAKVKFPVVNPHYSQKFSVVQTGQGPLNEVYVCAGADCSFGDATAPNCTVPPGAWNWYAKIVSAVGGNKSPRFKCVNRHVHVDFMPVATARWRWHPTDETMWIRCAGGCCEVTGEE